MKSKPKILWLLSIWIPPTHITGWLKKQSLGDLIICICHWLLLQLAYPESLFGSLFYAQWDFSTLEKLYHKLHSCTTLDYHTGDIMKPVLEKLGVQFLARKKGALCRVILLVPLIHRHMPGSYLQLGLSTFILKILSSPAFGLKFILFFLWSFLLMKV